MALGYNGMFGNIGLASAPLLAGLLNYWWNPRVVYLVIGLINLAGVPLAWRVSAQKMKKNHSFETQREGRLGSFIILLAVMMLGGIIYRGASVILPAYFQLSSPDLTQKLVSLWPAGLSGNLVATALTSMVYAVGILGQYIGGRAGERFEARWTYFVFQALAVPAVFLMGLTQDLTLTGLAIIYFFFLLGMQPIENTLVACLSPASFRHSAYGAKFVVTFGVGALSVELISLIESRLGLEAVFPFLGLIGCGVLVTVLLLIRNSEPVRVLSDR
jgi:MFS family permease